MYLHFEISIYNFFFFFLIIAGRMCHSSTGSFKDLFNLKLFLFFAGGEVRTTLIACTENLIKNHNITIGESSYKDGVFFHLILAA